MMIIGVDYHPSFQTKLFRVKRKKCAQKELDRADIVIALGKAWKRRNRDETVKPLMESSGCKSRTAKASTQAGSECCHSPGDWWVRSVHSKEAGREDSAPKTWLVAMPTPLT